ncbi:MAG TPA: DUF2946 family protein [Sphingomicrobium sp.]|nr:DUF2946 family protein [Sphingomicrobium sp.]
MRTAPALKRSICALLFALLLGLRLLGTAGYMPGFDHGAVTIVACPDADTDAPLALDLTHHHHGHSKHKHGGLCPYASASALGALGPEFGAFLAVLILTAALLLGRTYLFLERSRTHERPPLRGPPIPA